MLVVVGVEKPMNKFLSAASAVLFACGTAHATHFTFTDHFNNYDSGAGIVTGSFDGNLDGKLITNLFNISVFIDGIPFNGNGSLYSYEYGSSQSGSGVASLDGTQNNFLFTDSPNPYSGYSNYYESIPDSPLFEFVTHDNHFEQNLPEADNFIATPFGAVPEPVSWMLMLMGFGVVGGALRIRRATAVTFA